MKIVLLTLLYFLFKNYKLDISNEICELKVGLGAIGSVYAKSSVFGNNTEYMRYDLMLMGAYIRTLERNSYSEKPLAINSNIEGLKIKYSALKSQGNNLILDVENMKKCACVEYRNCLSDSEVCKIIDMARALSFKYKC